MALEEKKYNHLIELGGSDYEIVDGEPDIRGWKVKNQAGQSLGEVDDLLFDPQSQQVRYIIVDLKDADLPIEDDKKILVPIGVAALYDGKRIQASNDEPFTMEPIERSGILPVDEIDPVEPATDYRYNPADDGEVVVVPVTADRLTRLPAYRENYLDPDTELSIRHIYEGTGDVGFTVGSGVYDQDFYQHPHFNEDTFYSPGSKTDEFAAERERARRVRARYDRNLDGDPNDLI